MAGPSGDPRHSHAIRGSRGQEWRPASSSCCAARGARDRTPPAPRSQRQSAVPRPQSCPAPCARGRYLSGRPIPKRTITLGEVFGRRESVAAERHPCSTMAAGIAGSGIRTSRRCVEAETGQPRATSCDAYFDGRAHRVARLLGEEPAVDEDVRPGYVERFIRSEIDHCLRDLVRLCRALDRLLGEDVRDCCRCAHDPGLHETG